MLVAADKFPAQVFVPDSQFGFRKGCGTDDYSIVLDMALESKLEAI